MAVPFYIVDPSTIHASTGFRFSGSAWTQLAPPAGYLSTSQSLKTLAALPADPLLVYMVRADVNALMRSSDGGATWTEEPMPTFTDGVILPQSTRSLWTRAPGEVHLLNNRPIAADLDQPGVWRTTNDGVTWTRIIPFTGPAFSTAGGDMALGTSKLFYAELVSQALVGGQFDYTWEFNRANLDGTGIETWATHTFNTLDHKDPFRILLRAVSDDFVLAAANIADSNVADTEPQGLLWQIDASGITDVRPSAILSPWDLLPLTATRWLAVGTTQLSDDVLVYRTDNAGGSWSLMTTIPWLQGFNGSATQDTWFMLSAPSPAVPDEVVMLGYASSEVQHIVWTSTDGGATWTSMVNTADPFDGTSWAVTNTGGLASVAPPSVSVAIPSRLATIVG